MPETIYYDGHCGFCHRWVQFVLAHDPAERFHFAPLDQMSVEERVGLPDSVVVLTAQGTLLVESEAALYILKRLGGMWAFLATIGRWVPRPVRDFVYRLIAKSRYRIFGRREAVCPLVPPEMRRRFVVAGTEPPGNSPGQSS